MKGEGAIEELAKSIKRGELRRLAFLVSVQRITTAKGLGFSGYLLARAAVDHPEMTLSELGTLTKISSACMTGVSDTLVARRIARKERGLEDRRQIFLPINGREYGWMEKKRQEIEDKVFAELLEEEGE